MTFTSWVSQCTEWGTSCIPSVMSVHWMSIPMRWMSTPAHWMRYPCIPDTHTNARINKCMLVEIQLPCTTISCLASRLATTTNNKLNPITYCLLPDTWPWESGMVGWKASWLYASSPYLSSNNLILANLLSSSKEWWSPFSFQLAVLWACSILTLNPIPSHPQILNGRDWGWVWCFPLFSMLFKWSITGYH